MAWYSPRANRGYSALGKEKVTDLTDANDIAALREEEGEDLKETMEIGREGEEGCPNRWPEGDERFKETMVEFHGRCKELHTQVMKAIAVGLGIEEGWFDGYCDQGDNTLRLLHYPPVKASLFAENKNRVRAGAHTDYGGCLRCCEGKGGRTDVTQARSRCSSRTRAAGCRFSRRKGLLSTPRPYRIR